MTKPDDPRDRRNAASDDGRAAPTAKNPPRHRIPRQSPWLVLGFSLLVTWLAWLSAAGTLKQARQDYFDFRAREAIIRILQRMQACQQVLLGVQGLYKASVSVERREFGTYVER